MTASVAPTAAQLSLRGALVEDDWPHAPHFWCACADGGVGGWVGHL